MGSGGVGRGEGERGCITKLIFMCSSQSTRSDSFYSPRYFWVLFCQVNRSGLSRLFRCLCFTRSAEDPVSLALSSTTFVFSPSFSPSLILFSSQYVSFFTGCLMRLALQVVRLRSLFGSGIIGACRFSSRGRRSSSRGGTHTSSLPKSLCR